MNVVDGKICDLGTDNRRGGARISLKTGVYLGKQALE